MKDYGQALALLQLIGRKEFNALCKKWEMDRYVRTFPTWKQVQVLVFCYILKIESAREVELTFGVPKSTFCDANQDRASEFFEELCRMILWKIHAAAKARTVRQAIRNLLAMDSTDCSVHGSAGRFPFFGSKSGKKASVKLHVIWDVGGEWIEDFRITPGRKNDSPIAKLFTISKGKTYVFDRAYNDLGFWYKITLNDSHFVTRLKKCARRTYRHLSVLHNNENVGVLWEGRWYPSKGTLCKHPEVPKKFRIRHIIYKDPDTKRIFDFVTSDCKRSAQEIADIYKKRWSVELLFRWLKGHLNIRYFSVKTPNAIRVHVAIAVLVQLLVQLDRIQKKVKCTLWEHLRSIRANLWATILQRPTAKRPRGVVLQP